MSKQLKLTRPPLDETKKAFLEWKRLEKIQDNGRINSQKQLNSEKKKKHPIKFNITAIVS